jgi:hypothetical protein
MEVELSKEETKEQLIREIDKEFAQSKRVPQVLLMWITISLIAGAAVGFALVGSFMVAVGIIASAAQSPQWINLLGLGTAIMALGVSAGALIFTVDWEPRFRRATYTFHLDNLKRDCSDNDIIALHSLVEMRTNLPKSITLERVYTSNKHLFTETEFARRLLDKL